MLRALERAKKTGLPTMITVCSENEDVTSEGQTAAEAAKMLPGADIVGINCLRSLEHTLPLIKQMRAAVSGYIACQPVAYRRPKDKPDFTSLPEFSIGLDPLQLSRKTMADYAREARGIGVNCIGACCGAVATHIRQMALALGKIPPDNRRGRRAAKSRCRPTNTTATTSSSITAGSFLQPERACG